MAKIKGSLTKKKKYCPFATEMLHEYSERTTLHGIRYIGDEKRSLLERIWWLIAFIVSILCCGALIRNIVDKLDRTPVMVTFADKSISTLDVSDTFSYFF